MDTEELEQVKDVVTDELYSYLDLIKKYEDAIDKKLNHNVIDKLRIQLQREAPRITDYLVKIVGDFDMPHHTWIPNLSVSELLFSALLSTDYEMDTNIIEYLTVITSILNTAIGTVEAGLWPRKEVSPVLIIKDEELKGRCSDLLAAQKHYDRVFREATTILEDRIRNSCPHDVLSQLIPNSADQTGENLVNKIFAPKSPVLSISSDEKKRLVFYKILLGVFAYFRNPFHHSIDSETEWSWAWSVVGLVDILLTDIKSCVVAKNHKQ